MEFIDGLKNKKFAYMNMLKVFMLVLLLFGVSYSAWANTTFDRCMNITIKNAGATVLTNFPAYVNLTYDSDMQANYADLRFYNSPCYGGGTVLNYEIENYTATNAHIWVNIPSLSTGNTTISVYFKNSTSVSSGQNASGVWDNNYLMVMHLTETSGTRHDSTKYGNNGTAYAGVTSATGVVDGAQGLDGNITNGGYINTTSNISQTVGNITWEVWFKSSNTVNLSHIMWEGINTGNGWGADQEMHISMGYQNGSAQANFLSFYLGNAIPPTAGLIDIKTPFTDTTKFHYAVAQAISPGTASAAGNLYVDGSLNGTDTGTAAATPRTGWNRNLTIGKPGTAERYFNGTIDEVRVSNVTRSADWINETYQVVANQGTFVTNASKQSRETNPPIVSIDYPTEGLNLSTNVSIALNFTATDSDSGVDTSTCTYSLDGGSAVPIASCANTTFNVSTGEGHHNISVSARDNAGNTGTSAVTNFTIDKTKPSIALNAPAPGANITISTVNFNWTATDNLAATMLCNLTINGTVNATVTSTNGSATNYTVDFSSGTYDWNITCIDNAGNVNTSETRSFNIALCPGTITSDTTLTGNVVAAGNCVTFGANNIMLNCNGFSITGPGNTTNISIYSNGRNNVTMKNCIISGFDRAVYLQNTANSTVYNNTIYNTSIGVDMEGHNDNNLVDSNTIRDLESGGPWGYALYVNTNSGTTLNNFTNNNLYNIRFGVNAETQTHDNRFAYNNITNASYYGAYLIGNTTFEYNTVSFTNGYAVLDASANSVLRNNTIFNNSQAGIFLSSASGTAIVNNAIFNNSGGIYLSSASGTVIVNNTLYNNSGNQIQLTGSDNNQLLGNNLLQAFGGTDGYWIWNSVNNTVVGGTVSNMRYAFYFSNANASLVANVSLSSVDTSYSDSGSFNNVLLNISGLNRAQIYSDATSNVTVAWYTRANVTLSNGSAVSGASVNVKNFQDNSEWTDTTAASGLTSWHATYEGVYNDTLLLDFNNHTALATGAKTGSASANITGTTTIKVAVAAVCPGSIGPGVITLEDNYTHTGAGACFNLSSNTVLDCNGSTITGDATSGSYGAYASGAANATVRNCNILNFTKAIYLVNTPNSTVENNVLSFAGTPLLEILDSNHAIVRNNVLYNASPSNNAIYVAGSSDYLQLYNNTVFNSSSVAFDLGSDNCLVWNNSFTAGGGDCIWLFNADNNTLWDNAVSNANGRYAYYISNGFNNTIANSSIATCTQHIVTSSGSTNNLFINISGLNRSRFDGTSTSNFTIAWYTRANVTLQNGSPANGASVMVTDFPGATEWTDTTDTNGFTGSHVTLEGVYNDTLLLNFNNHTASATLGAKTGSASADVIDNLVMNVTLAAVCPGLIGPGVITLEDNYTHIGSGACFQLASNTELDCNGSSITGDNNDSSNAVYTSGNNVTVRNCTISGFTYGIDLLSSSNSHLLYNDISDSGNANIYLFNSDFNDVLGNELYTGSDAVLLDTGSDGNLVSGNTFFDNGFGVRVESSTGNNVSGNYVLNGTAAGAGVYVRGPGVNYVDNNDINMTTYGIYLKDASGGNFVRYNNIRDVTDGLRLQNANSTTFVQNTIYNAATDGILVQSGSTGNTFSGDNVSLSGSDGIEVASSNNNLFEYISVSFAGSRGIEESGNNFTLRHSAIFNNTFNGVEITGTGAIVTNNSFFNNSNYHLSMGGGNGVYTDNTFSGNGAYNQAAIHFISNNNVIIGGSMTGGMLEAFAINDGGANNNFVANVTLDDVRDHIMAGGTTTNNTFINITGLNRSRLGSGGANTNFTVGWYTAANVSYSDGSPVNGASVNVTSVLGNNEWTDTTSASGLTGQHVTYEALYGNGFAPNIQILVDYNDHTASAVAGFQTGSASANVTDNMLINITLAPTCPGSISPGVFVLSDNYTHTGAGNCFELASNTVLDCNGYNLTGDGNSSSNGVYILGKDNVTVRNCTISNFNIGVSLQLVGGVGASDVRILDNTFINNNYYAVSVDHSSNNTVSGNSIFGTGSDHGILVAFSNSGNVVSGNNLHNLSAGIFVGGNTTNNNITGNTVDNAVRAFDLEGSVANRFWDNNVSNSGFGFYFAEYIVNATDNNITGNVITNATSYGIYIDSYAANNNFVANYINSTDGIYGYHIDNAYNNTIRGGFVADNASFYMTGGAQDNFIYDVILYETSGNQIVSSGPSYGNIFVNITNLNRSKINNNVDGSNCTIGWYTAANVTSWDGSPTNGASVNVTSILGNKEWNDTTSASGLTGWYVTYEAVYGGGLGVVLLDYNNHNFSASKNPANSTSANVTDNMLVDIMLPPPAVGVTIQLPQNITYGTNTSLPLNYTVTGTPDTCQYAVDDGANVTITSCVNTTFNVTGDGLHNVTVFANSSAGIVNYSVAYFFVDTTKPSIVLNAPAASANLTNPTVDFNWTATDNVAPSLLCNLTINGTVNASNIPSASGTETVYSVAFPIEGTYTWNVTCWDNVSNMNASETRSFLIDVSGPVVLIQSPIDGKTYNVSNVSVDYTASDPNRDSCWYYLNGTGPTALPSCQNTSLDLADDDYNLTIYANDTLGTASSTEVDFTIDTTNPAISIESPTPSVYDSDTVDVNYTISDENPDSCWYYLDGAGPTSLSSCGNTSLTSLLPASYNLTIYANDSAGNQNLSTVLFTVIAPGIGIVKTVAPASVMVNRNATFAINVSNPNPLTNLTVTIVDVLPVNVTFNGASVTPTSVVGQTITWENITELAPGDSFVLRYNVSANKTGNYSNNATAVGVLSNGSSVDASDFASFTVSPSSRPSTSSSTTLKTLAITYKTTCPGDKLTVTVSSSGSVSGVEVKLFRKNPYLETIGEQVTDGNGKAYFTLPANNSYDIDASGSSYVPADTVSFAYSVCPTQAQPECAVDNDCAVDKYCLNGTCKPVQAGHCGTIANHRWVADECCADSDCASGSLCQNKVCVVAQQNQTTQNQTAPSENVSNREAGVALSAAQDAIAVAKAAGKDTAAADAKMAEALAAYDAGNYDEALTLAEEANQLAQNAKAAAQTKPPATTTTQPAKGGIDWLTIALILLGIGVLVVSGATIFFFLTRKGGRYK